MAEELTTAIEVRRAINLLEQEIATRRRENDDLNAKISDNNVFCSQARARMRSLNDQLQTMQAADYVASQTQLADKARAEAELLRVEHAALLENQRRFDSELQAKEQRLNDLLAKAEQAAAEKALPAEPAEVAQ